MCTVRFEAHRAGKQPIIGNKIFDLKTILEFYPSNLKPTMLEICSEHNNLRIAFPEAKIRVVVEKTVSETYEPMTRLLPEDIEKMIELIDKRMKDGVTKPK